MAQGSGGHCVEILTLSGHGCFEKGRHYAWRVDALHGDRRSMRHAFSDRILSPDHPQTLKPSTSTASVPKSVRASTMKTSIHCHVRGMDASRKGVLEVTPKLHCLEQEFCREQMRPEMFSCLPSLEQGCSGEGLGHGRSEWAESWLAALILLATDSTGVDILMAGAPSRFYSCVESFRRGLGTRCGVEVARSCTRSVRSRASQCAASCAVCYVPYYVPVRQTVTRLSHRFPATRSRYQIKSPETGNDLSEPYEPPSCDCKKSLNQE